MSDLEFKRVRSGEPSRTAHLAATLRAAHQLLDEPRVLDDPLAIRLLGAAAEAALRADPFVLNDPVARGLRAAVVARSRFVEDELAACVARGVGQYLVLGAGLDTVAFRRAGTDPGLRVFEIDHAGTQRWKCSLLADAGIGLPRSLTLVPMDFEQDDLAQVLLQAGFRMDQPACVSWMGVTPYLTPEALHRTLAALAGLAAGSAVCFDYRVPPALLGPVDRAIDDFISQRAAAAGEPWLSGFEPEALERQLLELGFGSAVTTTPDELNARYFARRKDGLRTGGSFRILCARTRRTDRGQTGS